MDSGKSDTAIFFAQNMKRSLAKATENASADVVRVGGCGVGVVGGGGVSGVVSVVGVVGFVGWCRYCWSYYWELVSFVLLVFAQGCSKTDRKNGT